MWEEHTGTFKGSWDCRTIRPTNTEKAQENIDANKLKMKHLSISDSDQFQEDKVKLGEPGLKERYYAAKFGAETQQEIEEVKEDVLGWCKWVF
ncbi:5'-3' exoribonuclease 3-like isoform X2 [Cryptomeria japonica]|uniref:5'-3' exoribonuclease 3-like isoform X2 n=1 Tax=Cryptomeria japonica TaxID=3369 RepID=UPI0027DA0336|nr:5'-3' exoribonuclease 3-like isoform X2 [Cryptomeria japonica]